MHLSQRVLVILKKSFEAAFLQVRAVSDVDDLDLLEMSHDVRKSSVRDFQSPQRQLLQVRCHPSDLVQKHVFEPVGMFQIELFRFFGQVNSQVFFSKDGLRQSFDAFDCLEVCLARAILALFKTDIVELFHLAAVIRILVWVRGLSEVGLWWPHC